MDNIENELYKFDIDIGRNIIGIDEAGRGPLAGPVVAGAAILKKYIPELADINDSKKLTEKKREKLYDVIKDNFYVGIGMSTSVEIDSMNILNATFQAMRRAIEDLKRNIKEQTSTDLQLEKYVILVDGNFTIRGYIGNQKAIVKGDGKSLSIAAASIMAKVTRDRLMIKEDEKYPQYGFKKHKGYGTKDHIKAILTYGPTAIHRESFLGNILHPAPKLDFGMLKNNK